MLRVKDVLALSNIDWTGKLVSVVFFEGCNFKCPYCHNWRCFSGGKKVSAEQLAQRIAKNELIDGVVLSGGEPTVQPITDMLRFVRKLKMLGLEVKLDTNGYETERVLKLVDAGVDYVAIDFKTDIERYDEVVGKKYAGKRLLQTLGAITKTGVEVEVRTTVVPTIVDANTVNSIAWWLWKLGIKKYVLQQFSNRDTYDVRFRRIEPYSVDRITKWAEHVKKVYGLDVRVREGGKEWKV